MKKYDELLKIAKDVLEMLSKKDLTISEGILILEEAEKMIRSEVKIRIEQ